MRNKKIKFITTFLFLAGLFLISGCAADRQPEENSPARQEEQHPEKEPPAKEEKVKENEPVRINMNELVRAQKEEQNYLMGQQPYLVRELDIDPGETREIAVGKNLLALVKGKEAIFFNKKDAREINRVNLQESKTGQGEIEFWNDYFVTSGREFINIYKVTGKEIEKAWSGEGDYYLESVDADYFINYGDGINVLEEKDGKLSLSGSLEGTGRVDDVVKFKDRFLAATEESGWVLFDATGDAEELKPAGMRNEMGTYEFYGVTGGGTLLASVRSSEGPSPLYQLWSLKDGNPRLVAENLLNVDEVSSWAGEDDKNIGHNFVFHPRTSKWLSYTPYEVYGAGYSVLELDESAVEEALEEGRYGEKARYQDKEHYTPLSDYIDIRDIGDRAFVKPAVIADVYGDSGIEFLASKQDGWYLIGERAGKVENIRLTPSALGTPDRTRVKLCELDKKAYFLRGDTLVVVDFDELAEVERDTVYPSLAEERQLEFRDEITGVSIGNELLAVITSAYNKEKLTVLDRDGGQEKYRLEREEGEIFWINGIACHWNPEAGKLQAFDLEENKKIWVRDLRGIDSSPEDKAGDVSAGTNHIYAATAGGQVFSLDASTGEDRWENKLSEEPREGILKGEYYYVKTEESLYVFNAESGKKEYKLKTGSKVLDLTNIARQGNCLATIGRPSFGDSTFYVYVYDLEKDELKWEQEAGYKFFPGAPAISKDTLYTFLKDADEGTRLAALDLDNGNKKWEIAPFPFYTFSTYGGSDCNIIYHDETVYAGDKLGYLYALDAEGNLKKKYNSGISPYHQARVAPRGFIKEKDGKLYYAVGNRLSVVRIP